MGLKRKRSMDISPSTSTSSFLSSPSRTSTSPCPDPQQYYNRMDIEAPIANTTFSSWDSTCRESLSSRLNSRTRKRVRDNRPDEETIHETTFQKLFSAQRQPQVSVTPSHSPLQPLVLPAAPVQKSTLHSFWNIPKAPPPQRIFTTAPRPLWSEQDTLQCQDCSHDFQPGAMDMDMIYGCNCGHCGLRVCDDCAVNKSYGRRCLGCNIRGV